VALQTTDKQVAEAKLRRIVNEREREREGLIAPKTLREAMRLPFSDHVKEFISELHTQKRAERYVANVETQLTTLTRECGWKTLQDVTAESFCAWRRKQKKTAKTLNEYLASARHFLGWLERAEKIERNRLKSVEKIENHTPTVQRRALSYEDAQRLLDVAGPRRTVYLIALTTGLRRSELRQLEWQDVRLDGASPVLALRAATTKNRRNQLQPLTKEAVEALREFRPAEASPRDKVFPASVPKMPRFRKDLEAAGIPYRDEIGRQVDLHALRKSFNTLVIASGASLRVAQELMRHSDPKLTAGTYTDAGHLPISEAVRALPSFGPTRRSDAPENALQSALSPVLEGPAESQGVPSAPNGDRPRKLINTGSRRDVTPPVPKSRDKQNGRGDRIRTCDLLVPNQALYQAKLRPATAG